MTDRVYHHRDVDKDGIYEAFFVNELSETVISISRYMDCSTIRLHLSKKQALDLADSIYFVCRPEDDVDPTEVPF